MELPVVTLGCHLKVVVAAAMCVALCSGTFAPELMTPGEVASWFRGPQLAGCRALIEDNKVDGLTLLELTYEEVSTQFGGDNMSRTTEEPCAASVRRVVSLMRKTCSCRAPIVDFWSALREDNFRTWFGGSLMLFTPRIGWIYAYLFDPILFDAVTSYGLITSQIVGSLLMVLCPDVFFAINVLPFLPMNYVLVMCAVQHYLVQTYEETTIVLSWWRGVAMFEPGSSLLQKINIIIPWWLFLPLGTLATGWLGIPLLFQQLLVALFVVQCAYVTMSLVFG